jgi:hypothetical protein
VNPHAGHTAPDDIPPVHVLEAAQNQDRKETEDLLAGFDRPGRGPKKSSPERDFVDYYAKKKGGAESGRASAPVVVPPPRQMDVSTVVKPRKTNGLPSWFPWAGAAALMLGIGGLVAYLATGDTPSSASVPSTPTGVPMAPPIQASRDIIPPPAPADPPITTTTTALTVTEPAPTVVEPAPPRPTGRREPKGVPGATAATTATGNGSTTTTASSADRKPPPRDDFIRDL